jgi:serine protease Do
VNDAPVKDARDLAKRIGAMAPGTTARLKIMRGGNEKNISLTLGELPKQRDARASTEQRDAPSADVVPNLGLSLAPGTRGEGAMIVQVDPNGVAAELGIKTGDVILEVAGAKVASPGDVSKHLEQARSSGKRTVLLRLKSGEATRFVALPLSRA